MHDTKEMGLAHHDQPGSDRGGGVGDRRRVLPVAILVAAVIALIACLAYGGVLWVGQQATKAHFGLTPTVATRAWQSNPGVFCAGVKELSPPQLPGTFILSTLVDSAPTAAAHTAAQTYYDNPTTANFAQVVASYSCKGGQS